MTTALYKFINLSGLSLTEANVFRELLHILDIMQQDINAHTGGGGDAATVTYTPLGTGAVAGYIKNKLDSMPSVIDWMTSAQYADGQTGTPALSVASAFSLAAINARNSSLSANKSIGGAYTSIAVAPMVYIRVPAGKWTLGSLVDTGGVDVTWELDAGAYITDYTNLNGTINREGQHIAKFTHGMFEHATGYAVMLNIPEVTENGTGNGLGLEGTPLAYGYTVPNGSTVNNPNGYPSADSVGHLIYNWAPPKMIDITNANYTSTTITPATPLTADQVKKLRVGMIIDTYHTNKCRGFITSWASNGTSITVSAWIDIGQFPTSPGWQEVAGSGIATTPANGTGAIVNPTISTWGLNVVTWLNADSYADRTNCSESTAINNKSAYNPVTDLPTVWGHDINDGGATYQASTGWSLRGNFYWGFRSHQSSGYAAFASQGNQTYHFYSEAFKVSQAGDVYAKSFIVRNSNEAISGYTLVGAHLTRSAVETPKVTKITATGLLSNENSYYSYDFGANYFDTNFYCEGEFNISARSGAGFKDFNVAFTNDLHNAAAIVDGLLFNFEFDSTNTTAILYAGEYVASTFGAATGSYAYTINTTYYYRFGALNGQVITQVYSDSNRTNILETLAYTRTVNAKFRYFMPALSSNYGTSDSISYTHANISLYKSSAIPNFLAVPKIVSGFATGTVVSASKGPGAFKITVGSSGITNVGVIGLPTAANGWVFHAETLTTGLSIEQTGVSTTSVSVRSVTDAGAITNFVSGQVILVSCVDF